jgi:hypothetical protein
MTDAVTLKIIATAISTGVVMLLVKIIWDWFINRKDVCKGCEVKEDVIRIKGDLEVLTTKIDKLSNVIMGNGDMDKSIAFRISAIETHIKSIQKVRPYIGR